MTVMIDYGVGNLFSLTSSFEALGAKITVSSDPAVLRAADRLILPGVGAFRDAADKLRASGLDTVIIDEVKRGKKLLGICLGMQMLFEKSYEYGEYKGLGLLKGEIRPIAEVIDPTLKIPHIGWNALHFHKACPLFRYLDEGDFVYFVHSYYATGCEDSLVATAEYSADLTAAVWQGNLYGCQFHPEKSGTVGLKILKAFLQL